MTIFNMEERILHKVRQAHSLSIPWIPRKQSPKSMDVTNHELEHPFPTT